MEIYSAILKDFMSFIRREYLEELTIKNISLLKTINVPLMRYFTHFTDEQLINISRIKLDRFLKDFEEGKAYEIAEKNFKLWEIDKQPGISALEIDKLPSISILEIDKLPGLSILEIDKLPSLSIDTIEPTDLIFFDVAQKQSLFHFIPKFTTDTVTAIKIIEALEDFYMKTQAAAFYLYSRLKAKSIVQALKLKEEGEAREEKARVQAFKLKIEREAIEFANKELESFSYSVSHDLRTPLRSIDGFSMALLENYSDKLDDKGKDFLNRIRTATQRMGQLIDELLKLSQLSKSEVYFEKINLSEISKTLITELKAINPAQEVTSSIEENLTANCDNTLITMVLENLINNAFKFTGKTKNAHIEFGLKILNNKNTFFVKDNGAGFDMSYSNLLFGAFQRLHRLTDFPGNGIGLATVKRIINKHGGEIWAEGEVDKGATFFFTLSA
jgi:signal transduction histidine kinase